MPHEKYTYISSRLIKEVASFGASVAGHGAADRREATDREVPTPLTRGVRPQRQRSYDVALLADRMKTLLPLLDPRRAGQGQGAARPRRRRHLVRRGRARLRHARSASRTPACEAMRARPDEVHRGRRRARSCGRRSAAASSSATTGSTTSRPSILVSVGAKHTLFNLVMALINPGDEVLVPEPVLGVVSRAGAAAGRRPGAGGDHDEATGFDLDPERLRRRRHAADQGHRASTARTTRPARSSRRRPCRRSARLAVERVAAGSSPTSATRR